VQFLAYAAQMQGQFKQISGDAGKLCADYVAEVDVLDKTVY
jgi:hypothetical protein